MTNNLAKHFEISNILLKFQMNNSDNFKLYEELKFLIDSVAKDSQDDLSIILNNIKVKYCIKEKTENLSR